MRYVCKMLFNPVYRVEVIPELWLPEVGPGIWDIYTGFIKV